MTYNELWHRLVPLYDTHEAQAITRLVLENRWHMTLTDIVCGKVDTLTPEEQAEIDRIFTRLAQAEPVQYVLGEETFGGRTFRVVPGTLIPRPETAELCQWVGEYVERTKTPSEGKETAKTRILDIGTGTGCIAVTLALDIKGAAVEAWDISPTAIATARENAERLGARVNVKRQDALNAPEHDHEAWDIIVSNPPYICLKEMADMDRNVLDYEPSTALFVPDDTPLLFYAAIARYAAHALKPGGMLFFEINPIYEQETIEMLHATGFSHTETRNDMFGKTRFTKATLQP